jgi:hypothetical protein
MVRVISDSDSSSEVDNSRSLIFDKRKRKEFRDYLRGDWDRQMAALLAVRVGVWRRKVILTVGGVLAAIAAGLLYAIGYQDWIWYELAFAVTGFLALIAGLLVRFRGKIKLQPELEQELSSCIITDTTRLVQNVSPLFAIHGAPPEDGRFVLMGFPDKRQLEGIFIAGRVGSDGRTRVTPFAVTVLQLMHQTVMFYEAVVDVTTGITIYERVRDFPYRSISWIGRDWRSAGPIDSSDARRAKALDGLTVMLSDGASISITISDSRFIDSWADKEVPPIGDEAVLTQCWRKLHDAWLKAVQI